MKQKIKNNKLNIIFFVISSLISFTIIFFHEAWRDEAQQWLIARDLDFFGLVKHLKYEGHFILWYLILMPFAKLGFPYITQNIISWFFITLSLWLFLKYSPFSNYKKILFLFLVPNIYFYPVISRCYCLIPLAIVLISMFYKDRKDKPIRYILSILLLINTHVIMLGMSAFLLLEFYIQAIIERNNRNKEQNKKILISFIIVSIGIIISFLPLLQCLTANKDIYNNSSISVKLCYLILMPLIILQDLFFLFSINKFILSIIILATSYLIYYELKNYKYDFFKICIVIFWQFIIYSFIYGISYQRIYTIIWIVIFFDWTREKNIQKNIYTKIRDISLIVIMLINIVCSLAVIYYDLCFNYSSAKQTSEYIKDNIKNNSVILVGNQEEFASCIIPYTDRVRFYNIQRERFFSYTIRDDKNKEILTTEKLNKALKKFENQEKIYYIYMPYKVGVDTDTKIVDEFEENGIFKKIFESDISNYSNENYVIYEIINDRDI